MQIQPYKKEIVLWIAAFIWLLFVATNVNVTLGQTYLHFALGGLTLLIIGITIFDKKLHITFQKSPGGTLTAIFAGLGGWVLLLITSVVVLRFIDPANANLASVVTLMGATTPALATSKIANLITFGPVVGFVETQLWARLLEFFADVFQLRLTKQKLFSGVLVLIALLSLGFLLFHLTAKGVGNTSALAIVFIMMFISLLMVVWFEESRQAVYLHIWANTVASYLALFAVGVLKVAGAG